MSKLKEQLLKKLEKIKGLESRPSKVAGGSALFLNNKEVAHFHHENELDFRLTKKLIKSEGLIHPNDSKFHKRSPSSEWIELRFYSKEDVDWITGLVASFVKSSK
jgi:hypothetical protein